MTKSTRSLSRNFAKIIGKNHQGVAGHTGGQNLHGMNSLLQKWKQVATSDNSIIASERGLNENSNGLLRQYFPKNMKLTDVTEEQVQWAVNRLNHRLHKVLGFKTHMRYSSEYQ